EIGQLWVDAYDGAHKTIETNYNLPGNDSTWQTADDVASETAKYTYDGSGQLSQIVYEDTGPDKQPGTADDYISREYEFSYGQGFALARQIASSGVDGTW